MRLWSRVFTEYESATLGTYFLLFFMSGGSRLIVENVALRDTIPSQPTRNGKMTGLSKQDCCALVQRELLRLLPKSVRPTQAFQYCEYPLVCDHACSVNLHPQFFSPKTTLVSLPFLVSDDVDIAKLEAQYKANQIGSGYSGRVYRLNDNNYAVKIQLFNRSKDDMVPTNPLVLFEPSQGDLNKPTFNTFPAIMESVALYVLKRYEDENGLFVASQPRLIPRVYFTAVVQSGRAMYSVMVMDYIENSQTLENHPLLSLGTRDQIEPHIRAFWECVKTLEASPLQFWHSDMNLGNVMLDPNGHFTLLDYARSHLCIPLKYICAYQKEDRWMLEKLCMNDSIPLDSPRPFSELADCHYRSFWMHFDGLHCNVASTDILTEDELQTQHQPYKTYTSNNFISSRDLTSWNYQTDGPCTVDLKTYQGTCSAEDRQDAKKKHVLIPNTQEYDILMQFRRVREVFKDLVAKFDALDILSLRDGKQVRREIDDFSWQRTIDPVVARIARIYDVFHTSAKISFPDSAFLRYVEISADQVRKALELSKRKQQDDFRFVLKELSRDFSVIHHESRSLKPLASHKLFTEENDYKAKRVYCVVSFKKKFWWIMETQSCVSSLFSWDALLSSQKEEMATYLLLRKTALLTTIQPKNYSDVCAAYDLLDIALKTDDRALRALAARSLVTKMGPAAIQMLVLLLFPNVDDEDDDYKPPLYNKENHPWLLLAARVNDDCFGNKYLKDDDYDYRECAFQREKEWSDKIFWILMDKINILDPQDFQVIDQHASIRQNAIFATLLKHQLFGLAKRFLKKSCTSYYGRYIRHDRLAKGQFELFRAKLSVALEDAHAHPEITANVLKIMGRKEPCFSIDHLETIVFKQSFVVEDERVQLHLFWRVLNARDKQVAHQLLDRFGFLDYKTIKRGLNAFERLFFMEILFEREQNMFQHIARTLLEMLPDETHRLQQDRTPDLPIAVLSGIVARMSEVDVCATRTARIKAETSKTNKTCTCGIPKRTRKEKHHKCHFCKACLFHQENTKAVLSGDYNTIVLHSCMDCKHELKDYEIDFCSRF